ncbi:MAG: DUF2065 domain-containing protein [Proteobacteria bacterium]|nr:MAG: DUF2065 domain-containing protein [Pseudomonadota bacterium]
MWQNLADAIALLLVIEGILPFVNPEIMRRVMLQMVRMDDRSLRFAGLTSMLLGLGLLYLL